MWNIPQLYGYGRQKMWSECDVALDNPSGGCPTVPAGIRTPRTIIIGNIYAPVFAATEFSTAFLLLLQNFVTGHTQQNRFHSPSFDNNSNRETVTVNTSQPGSHNPGNVQPATYVMLCKSRRFPEAILKLLFMCNCNLLPVWETRCNEFRTVGLFPCSLDRNRATIAWWHCLMGVYCYEQCSTGWNCL